VISRWVLHATGQQSDRFWIEPGQKELIPFAEPTSNNSFSLRIVAANNNTMKLPLSDYKIKITLGTGIGLPAEVTITVVGQEIIVGDYAANKSSIDYTIPVR
jgi:hypothetical protein